MAGIKFKCPFCGQKLSAEENWQGEPTECPNCHRQFDIPTDAGDAPARINTAKAALEQAVLKIKRGSENPSAAKTAPKTRRFDMRPRPQNKKSGMPSASIPKWRQTSVLKRMPLDIQWFIYALQYNDMLIVAEAVGIADTLPKLELSAFAEAVFDTIVAKNEVRGSDIDTLVDDIQTQVDYAATQAETGMEPPWGDIEESGGDVDSKVSDADDGDITRPACACAAPCAVNPLELKCPFCGHEMVVDEKSMGERVECPVCLRWFNPSKRGLVSARLSKMGARLVNGIKSIGGMEIVSSKTMSRLGYGICILVTIIIVSIGFIRILCNIPTIISDIGGTLGGSSRSDGAVAANAASANSSSAEKKPEVKKDTTVTVTLNLYDKGNNRINPMFTLTAYTDEEIISKALEHAKKRDEATAELQKSSDYNFWASMNQAGELYLLTTFLAKNYERAAEVTRPVRSGSHTFRLGNGGRCLIFIHISYYEKSYSVFKLINLDGVDKILEITNDDLF